MRAKLLITKDYVGNVVKHVGKDFVKLLITKDICSLCSQCSQKGKVSIYRSYRDLMFLTTLTTLTTWKKS